MGNIHKVTLKVNLINGEPIEFTVERDEEQLRNTGNTIESSFKANYMGIELEDKLTLIPAHNIATVEISPAPRVLVQHVIKGARRVT